MWAKKFLCGLGVAFACATSSLLPVEAATQRQTYPAQHAAAPLELASSSVLAVDLDSGQELYSSNPDLIRPIASITKLMTAMVVLDSNLPLNEPLAVTIREVHEMQGIFSRVRLGSVQTRRELLNLALMSSENRAAATLAHYYPGGYQAFIAEMNMKAKALGMRHTHFVEPTGLSEHNTSTARDLTRLLRAANRYGLIRTLSTTPGHSVAFSNPGYVQQFNNTNPLVRNGNWNIYLSKTGFTNAAGNCLVMTASMGGRRVAVALLDSYGKHTRFADAARLRTWLETGRSEPLRSDLRRYKEQRNQSLRSSLQASR